MRDVGPDDVQFCDLLRGRRVAKGEKSAERLERTASPIYYGVTPGVSNFELPMDWPFCVASVPRLGASRARDAPGVRYGPCDLVDP